MKIVVLDGHTENPGDLSWRGLEELGELTVYDRTDVEDVGQIMRRIDGADIVITNKTPLDRRTLAATPELKFISVLATGYNVIDCQAARAQNIPVSNVPDYGTAAVSQFSIGLLLEVCHRIGDHSISVHRGDWSGQPDFCYWNSPQIELAGKTMGIIGFGRIGQAEARIAAALGMQVLANSPHPSEAGRKLAEYVSLEELYARSDVISLHCPLTEQTRELINRKSIAQMKDGVILINNSRGQLLNEWDVAEALNSGKIAGAGLDVVSSEPIRNYNPLLTAENCIITPHISWAARASRQRIMDCTVANVKAFLEGSPIHVVNGL